MSESPNSYSIKGKESGLLWLSYTAMKKNPLQYSLPLFRHHLSGKYWNLCKIPASEPVLPLLHHSGCHFLHIKIWKHPDDACRLPHGKTVHPVSWSENPRKSNRHFRIGLYYADNDFILAIKYTLPKPLYICRKIRCALDRRYTFFPIFLRCASILRVPG